MSWDYPPFGAVQAPPDFASLPVDERAVCRQESGGRMSHVRVERRSAPRRALVLAAEVTELPGGAKLGARTSDVSLTGCYFDTLNPVSKGSLVCIRISHFDEVFEATARVAYVSPGLGMGVAFENVDPDQLSILDRWLKRPAKDK